MSEMHYQLTPAIAIIFDAYHIPYYTTVYHGETVPCVNNWGSAKMALIQAMREDGLDDEEKGYMTTLNAYNPEEFYPSTDLLIP